MAIKKKHVDLFGVPKGPIKILRGPGRGDVRAVGFRWPKTPDNISRDYRIIVDKIAFANGRTTPKFQKIRRPSGLWRARGRQIGC